MKALLLLVGLVAVAACDGSPSMLPGPVVAGTWGGENAGLIADDTSAHVHIGCTYGNVHQAIVPDPMGRFDVPGEHNITAYPVDRGILHPARFRGSITGRTMALTVTLSDTAVTLGPVVLTFGQEPRMGPCPICRRPRYETRDYTVPLKRITGTEISRQSCQYAQARTAITAMLAVMKNAGPVKTDPATCTTTSGRVARVKSGALRFHLPASWAGQPT